MKKKTLLASLLAVVVVIGGIVLMITRQAPPPVLVSRHDPPSIAFEEESHELGTVMEGAEIPYTFKIQNVGGEPLVIRSVSTSCGCTLLNLKNKYIEPGKIGELEVVMDTAMKKGYVRKQIDVFSNDPKRPKASVFLAANVIPGESTLNLLDIRKKEAETPESEPAMANTGMDPHMGLTNMTRSKIFTGQCATCHVLQGKGKMGGDLFQADCAMCHGQNAEGGVGPALVPGNYHDQEFANRIQKTIRYGSDDHPSMPGYLNSAGGPLTDAEINSIVQFLQSKSDQKLGQPTDLPGG